MFLISEFEVKSDLGINESLMKYIKLSIGSRLSSTTFSSLRLRLQAQWFLSLGSVGSGSGSIASSLGSGSASGSTY